MGKSTRVPSRRVYEGKQKPPEGSSKGGFCVWLDREGLGTMWGEQQARELLAEAGFPNVAVKQVEGDFLNNCYIARKR
jgi:hypothetical protein